MAEPQRGGRGAKMQRWITLVSGFAENLFFTGLVFGWASLVYVLKVDGYFPGYCFNATSAEDHTLYLDCSLRDEQFSRVMSVASVANTGSRFPAGYFFDRFGTTATRLMAISLYMTATLSVALSDPGTSVLLYPAMACLIVAGGMLIISNVQVGNLFDSHRSTIITVFSGAVDSSAGVFLIVKLLHEKGVSLHSIFLFFALCSISHLFRTFFLMPRGHIPYPLPENFTYGVSCRRHKDDTEDEASSKELLQNRKTEDVASFRSCVFSWLFLWHVVWLVTILLCQFIFLSNVNAMLTRLANNDQTLVSHYTNVFAFSQLCGVLFAPINGLIMDRQKHRPLAPGETKQEADLRASSLSLLLTSLQCSLFCVCFTTPFLHLQYVTFILQIINSVFVYGGHFAFISIAFPMVHYGKMSGVAMSLTAVALLVQFPILHLIQHQLHGDPFYVNISVTLVSLLTFTHPVHIMLHCRKLAKQRQTDQESGGKDGKCTT